MFPEIVSCACLSRGKSGNRALADIVGAGNAGGELLHQLAVLRPVGRRAGDLLAEYLSSSGRLQLLDLAGLVLGGGRDACIEAELFDPACRLVAGVVKRVCGAVQKSTRRKVVAATVRRRRRSLVLRAIPVHADFITGSSVTPSSFLAHLAKWNSGICS